MPGLTQWFPWNVELAGAKPTHFARTLKQARSADEIRPPRPGATNTSRNSFWVGIAAVALTAVIALAIILSCYLIRDTRSNPEAIEAINVTALVERIIKVETP